MVGTEVCTSDRQEIQSELSSRLSTHHRHSKERGILEFGKPDAIIYDPVADEVLFAIEETAAVPTGNQSLQRLERVWYAASCGIPFAYLIGEYGLHKDQGVRRSSIWPVYLS